MLAHETLDADVNATTPALLRSPMACWQAYWAIGCVGLLPYYLPIPIAYYHTVGLLTYWPIDLLAVTPIGPQ